MGSLAAFLDLVCLAVFGGWAYCVAKRQRRDEVGWLLMAAAAFWVSGYAMEQVIFPALHARLGWPETWAKPTAFLFGSLCATVLDLYLALVLKPLPASQAPASDAAPDGQAMLAGQPEQAPAEPRAPEAGGAGAAAADPFSLQADGPLGYLTRYWPSGIIVLMYLLPTFDAVAAIMPKLGFYRVHAGPYPPYREFAMPFLAGAQVWLWSRRVAPALLCGLFFAAFIPELNWMEWEWSRGSSYYSHGYLIPFVTLWLVWLNRARLTKLEPKGDLRGVGIATLAFGLLLLLLGSYLRRGSLQGVSFVVVMAGLVFFLYGRAISRVLVFPLVFTVSMIPMSMWMLNRFTFPLKMFATAGTVRVVNALHAVGLHPYAVVRSGSNVAWRLPDGTEDLLTVAEACSGLKSLIALLTFGALLAYLAKLSRRHKIVLFLAGVPVALLANMWRIVTLTVVAGRWGSTVARPDGWVHDSTGLGIFAVAFVLFFAFERVLMRFDSGAAPAGPDAPGSAAVA